MMQSELNTGINEACFPGVWKLVKIVDLYKNLTSYLRITDQLAS